MQVTMREKVDEMIAAGETADAMRLLADAIDAMSAPIVEVDPESATNGDEESRGSRKKR